MKLKIVNTRTDEIVYDEELTAVDSYDVAVEVSGEILVILDTLLYEESFAHLSIYVG